VRARGGSPYPHLAPAVLLAALLAAPGALAAPPTQTTPAASTTTAAQPAQEAAPAVPAPTVDEIVARFVAARGGIEKLRSIQTLREEGRIHAGPGRDGLVTRELKRPGRMRVEFTVQGVTEVFASDGKHGWKVTPLEGAKGPERLPDDEVRDARESADPDGPLVDWKSKGNQVELVGREAVDGHEAYKLKVTLKTGETLTAWIDVKSAYLVRTEADRKLRGRTVKLERTFGDYRKTEGILFPHLIEIRTSGRPQVIRVVLEKIELNPPLSDARFSPPT